MLDTIKTLRTEAKQDCRCCEVHKMPGVVRKWQNVVNHIGRPDINHRTQEFSKSPKGAIICHDLSRDDGHLFKAGHHTQQSSSKIFKTPVVLWNPTTYYTIHYKGSHIIFPVHPYIFQPIFSKNAHIWSLFTWVISSYVAQSTTSWDPHNFR
jgi:hypothetical protein